MKQLIRLFIFLSLISTAIAMPTLNGASGLITMPTAEVLDYKQYNMASDFEFNTDDSDASRSFYKMNVGALENTELGFVGGTDPDEGVFLNMKWYMTSGTGRFPLSMAVGFENLTSNSSSDFYLVASKRLRADLGVHGGFQALFEDKVDVSLMVGADYAYNDHVVIVGDLNGNGNKYYINSGILIKVIPIFDIQNLYFRASATNLLRNEESPTYFNLGLSYSGYM